jgi:hypothetical protein
LAPRLPTDYEIHPQSIINNNRGQNTITNQNILHKKASEEIAKFEKTMEELKLLKYVSKDLKNYRKMIKLKKFD